MKNSIIILLVLLLGMTGCQDWFDINSRPSSPDQVPMSMSMAASELIVATRVGGTLYNDAAFYAQYWEQAPEANQYNGLAKYRLTAGDRNVDYREFYAGALKNLEQVRVESKGSGEWGYYIAATTLRAYVLQILVDLFDQIPYSEALDPNKPQPRYDDGAVVYAGVLAELDEALSHAASAKDVDSKDLLIAKGSIHQWIGFAKAIKLKMLMRQSNIKDVSVAVKQLIDEADFFTGDIKFSSFVAEVGRSNPWYETNVVALAANNHVGTFSFISTLDANADPRLEKLFKKPAAGHKGSMPGGKGETAFAGDKTVDFSQPTIGRTQPVYLYSQAELQFFIAEAEYRFNNNSAAAQAAYQAAIDASCSVWAVDGSATYGPTGAYRWGKSDPLIQIYTQKWISLAHINNIEAFAEIRRTGYPQFCTASASSILADPSRYEVGKMIDPYVNDLGTGKRLNRTFIPEISTTRNPNAPKPKGLTEKMFWQL